MSEATALPTVPQLPIIPFALGNLFDVKFLIEIYSKDILKQGGESGAIGQANLHRKIFFAGKDSKRKCKVYLFKSAKTTS